MSKTYTELKERVLELESSNGPAARMREQLRRSRKRLADVQKSLTVILGELRWNEPLEVHEARGALLELEDELSPKDCEQ